MNIVILVCRLPADWTTKGSAVIQLVRSSAGLMSSIFIFLFQIRPNMGQKTQVQIDPEDGSFNTGEEVDEKSNFKYNNLSKFFTYN
jgi:hypothetical protein